MGSWTKWQRWKLCPDSATWVSNFQVWPVHGLCWVLISQHRRLTLAPFPMWSTSSLVEDGWNWTTAFCFYRNKHLPVFGFAFPACNASAETTFVNLKNASSTVVISHKALLLIKELTSHRKNHNDGSVLMQFTNLMCFPPPLLVWECCSDLSKTQLKLLMGPLPSLVLKHSI